MNRDAFHWLLCWLLVVQVACTQDNESGRDVPYCQILDRESALYGIGLGFLPKREFEGYERNAFLEVDGDWAVAYFHDVYYGDIDVALRLRATLIMDSAGLRLPNQVVEISADAAWAVRTMRGTSFQTRIRPGVYSDLEELGADALYVPFSLAVIQSFVPDMSGIAGVEVRTGFDRTFIPLIGIAWQPAETFRLEAGVPESRLEWFVDPFWSVYTGFEWLNSSYRLREESGLNRRQITLEDYRAYAGLSYALSHDVRLSCEMGAVFDRSVKFERTSGDLDRNVDISDGFFVHFGVACPL